MAVLFIYTALCLSSWRSQLIKPWGKDLWIPSWKLQGRELGEDNGIVSLQLDTNGLYFSDRYMAKCYSLTECRILCYIKGK